jgi:hypothetical protein
VEPGTENLSTIKLLLFNIEGIKNVYDLMGDKYFKNFDVLIFTETFATSYFQIPGFYSVSLLGTKHDRGRPMRGVSVYYNSKLGHLQNFHILENSVVLNFNNVTIIASYLPPKLTCDSVWEEFNQALNLSTNQDSLIYAGDFNCRIDTKNNKGELVFELCDFNELKLENPTPYEKTYVASKGSSTIDLILTSKNIIGNSFSIVDTHFRKHRAIEFNFNVQITTTMTKAKPRYKIDNDILEKLINDDLRSDLQQNLNEGNIEAFYSNLLLVFQKAHSFQTKYERKSQPWYDEECYLLKRELDFLRVFCDTYRNYFLSPQKLELFHEISDTLFTGKKFYKKLCSHKKHQYNISQDIKMIEEAEKQCHKILSLNNKEKYAQNDITMDKWEKVFAEVYNKKGLQAEESLNLNAMLQNYSGETEVRNIIEAELLFAIKGFKNKKAPGLDSIGNESLKIFVNKLTPQLTQFYNHCLKNATFPERWKDTNLKLLYKGAGDKNDTNNYRGINISCSLYNLLDKIMKNRIYSHLAEEIPSNQFGFMRGRSTMDAVKILLDDVQTSVYCNGKPRYALFLDVRKAFDSISREYIYNKVMSSNKLNSDELKLLAEMLDLNYLIVNDGVSTSQPIVQSNGVKQGASLSPFLFIYALSDINDIFKDCPGVKVILYADDVVLLCDNLEELQRAAEKFRQYLHKMDLELNEKKCKIMKFKNKGVGRPCKKDFLILGSEILKCDPDFKYLGVTLQASGKCFSKHIAKRVSAAIFATYKIKNLSQMSIEAGLKLFDLAIAPIASYGIEVIWPHLTKNDLQKLETAKSRFLKRLLGLSKVNKSRFTYQLADCDLFVSDLCNKFNLCKNDAYENFISQNLINTSTIENKFYDTPAMTTEKWKMCNFVNRHVYTRHACHGFHYTLCKSKHFHYCAEDDCECEKCGKKMDTYHFLYCEKNTLSLYKVAKATEELKSV